MCLSTFNKTHTIKLLCILGTGLHSITLSYYVWFVNFFVFLISYRTGNSLSYKDQDQQRRDSHVRTSIRKMAIVFTAGINKINMCLQMLVNISNMNRTQSA